MENFKMHVLLIIILSQSSSLVNCFVSLQWSTNCSSKFVFTNVNQISLLECAEKCIRRKQCLSINYFRSVHDCHLVGNTSSVIDFVDTVDIPCVTWVKDGGPYNSLVSSDDLGIEHCEPNPCAFGEVCNSDIYGTISCTREECRLPAEILNGQLWSNVNHIGSKAVFACNYGYQALDGTGGDIECGPDGNWTLDTFTCIEKCGIPPMVENAIPSSVPKMSPLYTKITYNCSDGFSSQSPVSVKCLPDNSASIGNWSEPTDTCNRQCLVPVIYGSHTILTNTNSTYYSSGSQIEYKCAAGFTPTGVQTINCTSGVWLPIAVCTPSVDCSSSLYQLDPTYGICYKRYDSILTAAAEIVGIFEGSLLDMTSTANIEFAEYIMTTHYLSRLYVGLFSEYINSTLAKWADGEPKMGNDCVEIKRYVDVFTWNTLPCSSTIDYIIVKIAE